jgi:nicotinamide-nucleotide amidase
LHDRSCFSARGFREQKGRLDVSSAMRGFGTYGLLLTAARAVVNSLGMPDDALLFDLATRVGRRLHSAGRRMATAESCTAGWIAKVMTDVAGSSAWFECGYVTYSNAAKVRDLGVSQQTLDSYGAVSEQTVREMARGALRVSGADIAVAVSGIAGPDGGVPGKPVGTVWFAIAHERAGDVMVDARRQLFERGREVVRRRSVEFALELVLQLELPRKA